MKIFFASMILLLFVPCEYCSAQVKDSVATANDTTTLDLDGKLYFLKSDSAFSYYKIVLTNLTDSLIEIPYAEGCFDPASKDGNELGCGMIYEKYYSAILYNMDHMEISKYIRIKAHRKTTIYVKWSLKNNIYKKTLAIKYYSKNGENAIGIDF